MGFDFLDFEYRRVIEAKIWHTPELLRENVVPRGWPIFPRSIIALIARLLAL